MIGLVVRFDLRDAASARRFDELTAEAVALAADGVRGARLGG